MWLFFSYQDLLTDDTGGTDGFCNCNQCEESNGTIAGECPRDTEVCFHPDRYGACTKFKDQLKKKNILKI